jgi:membrane peptidoglycan carboxypeptidase
MSPEQAYLMNTILSDTSDRPEAWNSFLTLPGRKVAAKTGTSTKQYSI